MPTQMFWFGDCKSVVLRAHGTDQQQQLNGKNLIEDKKKMNEENPVHRWRERSRQEKNADILFEFPSWMCVCVCVVSVSFFSKQIINLWYCIEKRNINIGSHFGANKREYSLSDIHTHTHHHHHHHECLHLSFWRSRRYSSTVKYAAIAKRRKCEQSANFAYIITIGTQNSRKMAREKYG